MPLTDAFLQLVRRDLSAASLTSEEAHYLEQTDVSVLDAWKAALLTLLAEEEAREVKTHSARVHRRERVQQIHARLGYVREVRRAFVRDRAERSHYDVALWSVQYDVIARYIAQYEEIALQLAYAAERIDATRYHSFIAQTRAMVASHRDVPPQAPSTAAALQTAFGRGQAYIASLEEILRRALADLAFLKADAAAGIVAIIASRQGGAS